MENKIAAFLSSHHFYISGETFLNVSTHFCLLACARMSSCSTAYYNESMDNCFISVDKLSCLEQLESSEFIYVKEDGDGQFDGNILSAHFRNTNWPE